MTGCFHDCNPCAGLEPCMEEGYKMLSSSSDVSSKVPVSQVGNTGTTENGEQPPCPRCGTDRPFGPADIRFEGKVISYVDCRRCGYSYMVPTTRTAPPVPVTLPEQQAKLEATIAAGPELLTDFIADHWPEICRMARQRIVSGYENYGSTMFSWDAITRHVNVLEEAADAVVYLSSG